MPIVTSRVSLASYALRKLGSGILRINVTDDQVQDCIDDGLQFMAEYHFDGVQRMPMKYTITDLDFTNQYITIPNNVISIIRVLPVNDLIGGTQGGDILNDATFQIALNDLVEFGSIDIQSYVLTRNHLKLLQLMLSPEQEFRFNRTVHKLNIDTDWSANLPSGKTIVFECYVVVDPEVNTDLYNDMILKKYVTALIKKQWGVNLSKFKEVKLPGGVVLNGDEILEKGTEEVEKIEKEIQSMRELPVEMLIG